MVLTPFIHCLKVISRDSFSFYHPMTIISQIVRITEIPSSWFNWHFLLSFWIQTNIYPKYSLINIYGMNEWIKTQRVLEPFILKREKWWERRSQNSSSPSVLHWAFLNILWTQGFSHLSAPQNHLKGLWKYRWRGLLSRDPDSGELSFSGCSGDTRLGPTHGEPP